jgi:hypothetical protein
MKSLLRLAFLYLASAGIALGTTPATITFDELTPSTHGDLIPNGYAGLQWNNFYVLNAVSYIDNPSGYQNAVVSANNVAFNGFGDPSMVSATAFDLNSAYLGAAWNDGLQVEVQGFVGATLTYDNTYTVNTTGPTLINFNYLGVDEVSFIASGGTLHPGYTGSGTQFAIDNLTLTLVPEPTLFGLVGLGAAALMSARPRVSAAHLRARSKGRDTL